MLQSSHGVHNLGSLGNEPEESRNKLNKMIKIAKKYQWSVIGEPIVIAGKNGKTYMYQKIMKLHWGKDEPEQKP